LNLKKKAAALLFLSLRPSVYHRKD